MKKIVGIFFMTTVLSYGQETRRENVSLEANVGNALVSSKAHGNMFGTNLGAGIGVDFYKSGQLSVRTGLMYNASVFQNHTKTNTTNQFVGIPVSFRLSSDKENIFTPYVEFGLYGKSLVSSVTQYEKSKSFDGFTTGLKVELGFLLKQSTNYSVGVKILSEGDFYSTVKHQGEKYQFRTFSAGLEFRMK